MLTETITKEDKDIVFISTTCKDREEARKIAFASIECHLAVCADYSPVESIYPWQGAIEDIDQYMLILTTKKTLAEELKSFIENMHSYSIPMIAQTDRNLNEIYRMWVFKTLNAKEDYKTKEEIKIEENVNNEDGYHPGKLK